MKSEEGNEGYRSRDTVEKYALLNTNFTAHNVISLML